jgi:hypothetical protein
LDHFDIEPVNIRLSVRASGSEFSAIISIS